MGLSTSPQWKIYLPRIGRGSYGFIYAGFHYKANLRFDENDTETIKFNQKMVKIHPGKFEIGTKYF